MFETFRIIQKVITMRTILTTIADIVLTAGVFAQTPQKMSYKAVIRNSSNVLVP